MADFLGMMKQAAQLQSKMKEMQESLDLIEVDGEGRGGGLPSARRVVGDGRRDGVIAVVRDRDALELESAEPDSIRTTTSM